ncbi:hypothetical protein [Streptomyces sp. NPDC002187]|uniref:hypothetical protein n=1 Tax=Streptomyces sp. NPDC002187 TaxID=3364637 RepID=UPI00368BB3C8
MGYDVHITRRENWWDEQGPDISTQEWEAVVAADPDLVMFPMPEGGWLVEPRWIAESVTSPGVAELGGALDWRAGRITAKWPCDALLAKMCRVAKTLGARVQGDDGEYYDA